MVIITSTTTLSIPDYELPHTEDVRDGFANVPGVISATHILKIEKIAKYVRHYKAIMPTAIDLSNLVSVLSVSAGELITIDGNSGFVTQWSHNLESCDPEVEFEFLGI